MPRMRSPVWLGVFALLTLALAGAALGRITGVGAATGAYLALLALAAAGAYLARRR
jgi:hypothetical protein